jgi:3-dehydroquinate synthase
MNTSEHIEKISREIKLSFKYDVDFTAGVFDASNPTLESALRAVFADEIATPAPRRLLFVLEKTVLDYFPDIPEKIAAYSAERLAPVLTEPAAVETFEGGERLKHPYTVKDILELINQYNLDRHAIVGIVGGGAFLDAVGLAASLAHRGLRQLRLPTTVLSQCDSGVGVKTGVNMFGKKNYIGTFAPPAAVVNDFNFLETLGKRDWNAGIPEAFKVAMIKDAEFFQWLLDAAPKLAERDRPAMEALVKRCATIHLDHIATSGDPFETGSARPLDFGHWLAHKLETLTAGKIRHGEAVALGLLVDSLYAVEKGLLDKKHFDDMKSAFETLGIPTDDGALVPSRPLVEAALEEFREHLGGELHITLPNTLGNKIEATSMDVPLILDSIKRLKNG